MSAEVPPPLLFHVTDDIISNTLSMYVAPRRNEKESSVDRDFQRSVSGVCGGTLSPRQRHSLRRHAESKKSGNRVNTGPDVCSQYLM